jgi:hypothetical protein
LVYPEERERYWNAYLLIYERVDRLLSTTTSKSRLSPFRTTHLTTPKRATSINIGGNITPISPPLIKM